MMSGDRSSGPNTWTLGLFAALGLIFSLLNRATSSEPSSPYSMLEYCLFGLFVIGLWNNNRWQLPLSRRSAPWVFIILSWAFGMTFELTLTLTGEGVGGLHSSTWASFLLVQGDYIPIAIITFVMIRSFKLSVRDAFYFGMGISLTEGLAPGGVLLATILSPMILFAPLVLAYFALAYGYFVAMPLMFIDPTLLWKDASPEPARSAWPLIAWGVLIGIGIRLFWGLVYGPVVEFLFSIPPQIPEATIGSAAA